MKHLIIILLIIFSSCSDKNLTQKKSNTKQKNVPVDSTKKSPKYRKEDFYKFFRPLHRKNPVT